MKVLGYISTINQSKTSVKVKKRKSSEFLNLWVLTFYVVNQVLWSKKGEGAFWFLTFDAGRKNVIFNPLCYNLITNYA